MIWFHIKCVFKWWVPEGDNLYYSKYKTLFDLYGNFTYAHYLQWRQRETKYPTLASTTKWHPHNLILNDFYEQHLSLNVMNHSFENCITTFVSWFTVVYMYYCLWSSQLLWRATNSLSHLTKKKNEVPLNCYVTRPLLTIIQVLYLPLYAGKVTILERVVIDDLIPHMVVTRIKWNHMCNTLSLLPNGAKSIKSLLSIHVLYR